MQYVPEGKKSVTSVTGPAVVDYYTPLKLRANFRRPTSGPEYDLVQDFIASGLPKPPPGQCLTIFIEPRTHGVFPDVIAIYWRPNKVAGWPQQRKKLASHDIRVLSLLDTVPQGLELEQLGQLFPGGFSKSVENLQRCGMVYVRGSKVFLRSKKKNFAIERLIAIEAKIDAWKAGLKQAQTHKWFTNESYLLLPHVPEGKDNILQTAANMGIGVIVSEANTSVTNKGLPVPRSLPVWEFNEWLADLL